MLLTILFYTPTPFFSGKLEIKCMGMVIVNKTLSHKVTVCLSSKPPSRPLLSSIHSLKMQESIQKLLRPLGTMSFMTLLPSSCSSIFLVVYD